MATYEDREAHEIDDLGLCPDCGLPTADTQLRECRCENEGDEEAEEEYDVESTTALYDENGLSREERAELYDEPQCECSDPFTASLTGHGHACPLYSE